MSSLVLSLFPGIGLLDMAFEEEGFCVVRGPDLLWGGDVRRFHPPTDKFVGVMGGPPCQMFSRLRYLQPLAGVKHGNMIPEFERCVSEARPMWFLMENVKEAPEPAVAGYIVKSLPFNNRWVGAEQQRARRFSFGTADGRSLLPEVVALEAPLEARFRPPTVLAGHGPIGRGRGCQKQLSLEECCRLQGLPDDFTADMPFTSHDKRKIIGNGVPLPMGRAIAKAVKRAMNSGSKSDA